MWSILKQPACEENNYCNTSGSNQHKRPVQRGISSIKPHDVSFLTFIFTIPSLIFFPPYLCWFLSSFKATAGWGIQRIMLKHFKHFWGACWLITKCKRKSHLGESCQKKFMVELQQTPKPIRQILSSEVHFGRKNLFQVSESVHPMFSCLGYLSCWHHRCFCGVKGWVRGMIFSFLKNAKIFSVSIWFLILLAILISAVEFIDMYDLTIIYLYWG